MFVIALCVSGADLYFGGRLCFSNCQIFRNAFLPIVGYLTLTVKNPPVTELRDTLKHMNDSWKRLIETKRFKSGVAGFLRTTEVTRGNDGDMMAHPHFHALLLVKPSYFKGQGYIKQADWVEMWAKALRADYLPSVNVKAVKATLMKKDASNSIKQFRNAQIQRKTV